MGAEEFRYRWKPKLLRPLGWSIAVHAVLLVLFSAGVGRSLQLRSAGIWMNWAVLTPPETAILLQPQDQPDRVTVSPGLGPNWGSLSLSRDPVPLAADRLRNLRVPLEPHRQPRSPRIEPQPKQSAWLQKPSRPGVTQVDRLGLTAPVSQYRLPIPGFKVLEAEPPAPIDTSEWRHREIAWPPGKKAGEVGVEGPSLLRERTLLSYEIPPPPSSGPPVIYRFAVGRDGRVTQMVPLSAPEGERALATYRALLNWRFAPMPSWGPQDELWGKVRFE